VATISFDNVSKAYANGSVAVSGLSLEIANGEFMVLVGPSGCGKTTSLRMVAGLEDITSGTISIGDRVVNSTLPKDRDVAMVFQNYALYPHMTVRKNIGFALKLRRDHGADRKVTEIAAILGLTELLDRKPAQLSGGQRQRVAMGRAMVREPAAFLMDEPLSNLDAKLRTEMRAEVSRLQRRVGVATLYVTHDQVEAMTMGDRVAVMDQGVLQQCAPPQTLYDFPKNVFVASFIGSPGINLYEGVIQIGGDGVELVLGDQRLELDEQTLKHRPALSGRFGDRLIVGLRPEHLSPSTDPAKPGIYVVPELVEALGSEKLLHFRVNAQRPRDSAPIDGSDTVEELESLITVGTDGEASGIAKAPPHFEMERGRQMRLSVDVEHLHFFDPATGSAIRD
jgi:multiple sugar transport system ATP-binding protein